jgi:hypothetical protein
MLRSCFERYATRQLSQLVTHQEVTRETTNNIAPYEIYTGTFALVALRKIIESNRKYRLNDVLTRIMHRREFEFWPHDSDPTKEISFF